MRSLLARAASITWLAAAAALATFAAPGCRFAAPPGAAGDDGVGDAGPADVAPDAPPDAAPDASTAPACMADPTYSDHDGHRYKLHPSPNLNYDAAIDLCAGEGAHLVVVDSAVESDYLEGLIDTDVWIGFDDLAVEGSFQWVTGATSTYRAFTGNEPNNSGNEDCVYMRDDGSWNDTGCEDFKRVLCECAPAYTPPKTPMCRKATNGFSTYDGRRYFARNTPRTWQDAENDCQSIGAHLLVISDGDENATMDGFLFTPHWIGYTDADTESQFKWVDGSPSTYHRFVGGVPGNQDQDCVVLQDFGGWADQSCDATYPYACECDPSPP